MDDEKPYWRRVFDAIDSEIAPKVEAFVRTEQFADAMALMNRMNQQAAKAAAEFNQQMLNYWNIPSQQEITDHKKQLATMERQLYTMSKALKEAQHGDDRNDG